LPAGTDESGKPADTGEAGSRVVYGLRCLEGLRLRCLEGLRLRCLDLDFAGDLGSEDALGARDADAERAVEGSAVNELDSGSGHEAELGEVAELGGVVIGHLPQETGGADGQVREGRKCDIHEFSRCVRNRCPVRVGVRLTEHRGHPVDELFRRGVLEVLGFGVDPVP
jgi:hypothetical protein